MAKKTFVNKLLLIMMPCLMLAFSCPAAFGEDGSKYYNSWNGHQDVFGERIAVPAPPASAVVNKYNETFPQGFIVTPYAGISVISPSKPGSYQYLDLPIGSEVENVVNSDGTSTFVTLIKHGNGYIGPQGEYYPSRPTPADLGSVPIVDDLP